MIEVWSPLQIMIANLMANKISFCVVLSLIQIKDDDGNYHVIAHSSLKNKVLLRINEVNQDLLPHIAIEHILRHWLKYHFSNELPPAEPEMFKVFHHKLVIVK